MAKKITDLVKEVKEKVTRKKKEEPVVEAPRPREVIRTHTGGIINNHYLIQ